MIMKKLFSTTLSVALLGLSMSQAGAAEALKPDAAGYIRDWVMLAPIALPEAESCAELIAKEQVKDEAALKPKVGDKTKIDGRELAWKNITAATNHFDFNAILKTENDHAAGFMVTYLECDREMTEVTMAIASNDQGRLYLNGKDIYVFT